MTRTETTESVGMADKRAISSLPSLFVRCFPETQRIAVRSIVQMGCPLSIACFGGGCARCRVLARTASTGASLTRPGSLFSPDPRPCLPEVRSSILAALSTVPAGLVEQEWAVVLPAGGPPPESPGPLRQVCHVSYSDLLDQSFICFAIPWAVSVF
jgi:hypothetical protein